MGESKIEWCDYTFNPWHGCTKISPGCKNCYAVSLDRRFGGNHWGPTAPRKFFGDTYWSRPLTWNRKAEKSGSRKRVFCSSMSDVFEVHQDDEVNKLMDESRLNLWKLIAETPSLDWLILTKRPENADLDAFARWSPMVGVIRP